MKPFFGKTGSDLRIGRNVVFHNPKDIVLGSHIYIAYGSVFLANSLICIGDEVIFGPYCVVASGDHTMLNGSFRYGVINSKPIKIESGCWIGSHSVITAGVSIEKGALVGAGSVITEDVPATTLVGGVPARKIKELNVESE
jgi:maltose O-acetyltransferase